MQFLPRLVTPRGMDGVFSSLFQHAQDLWTRIKTKNATLLHTCRTELRRVFSNFPSSHTFVVPLEPDVSGSIP